MIVVEADWTPLLRYLDSVQRKQLPYVTARATTKLAQLSQEKVRASLPRNFTIRSQWLSRGIRIQRGEKRDWPAVQAIVGAIDWFMEFQETGADRKPHSGRDHLSVPGRGVRPTKETKVTRAKWPGALLKKGGKRKAFVNVLSGGLHKGKLAVLRRDTTDRYPLQVLYVFERKTKGKKRLGMVATVTPTVRDNYSRVFLELMQQALQPRTKRSSS